MIRRLTILFLACILVLGCAGCQLARPEAGEAAGGDRLIGAFVTREYLDLFDFESYFSDNADDILSGGEVSVEDSAAYQERYYATLKENNDYVFEGLEGVGFYTYKYADETGSYNASHIDDGMVGNGLHYIETDEGETVELDGTIYVSPQSNIKIYVNPVYQATDGSVYLTAGSGFSTDISDSEGEVYSTTLEETTTVTDNGEAQTEGCKVTVRLAIMFAPVEITVIQMDENSREIRRDSYQPDAVPDTLAPAEDCAYIIVETHKLDGKEQTVTTRELVGLTEDSFFSTFRAREDGVCVRQDTEILLPGRDET